MAQLSLFSRSQVAYWRDRNSSRNHSPEREQFRREHARHREWGLRQRHGRKTMYLRIYGDITPPYDRASDNEVSEPSAPGPAGAERLPAAASSGNVSSGRALARTRDGEDDQTDPAAETASAQPLTPAGQAAADGQAAAAGQAAPADQPRPPIRPNSPSRQTAPCRAGSVRSKRSDAPASSLHDAVNQVAPPIWPASPVRADGSCGSAMSVGRALQSPPTADRAPPPAPRAATRRDRSELPVALVARWTAGQKYHDHRMRNNAPLEGAEATGFVSGSGTGSNLVVKSSISALEYVQGSAALFSYYASNHFAGPADALSSA
jgi:hypothetical protein